jgi:hypothetical protein
LTIKSPTEMSGFFLRSRQNAATKRRRCLCELQIPCPLFSRYQVKSRRMERPKLQIESPGFSLSRSRFSLFAPRKRPERTRAANDAPDRHPAAGARAMKP